MSFVVCVWMCECLNVCEAAWVLHTQVLCGVTGVANNSAALFIIFQHCGHKAKIKRRTWYTTEKATLVYDAELLRSLIYEDKAVRKI